MRSIRFRAWIKRYEIIDLNSSQTWNTVIRDKMVPVTGLHFWEGEELTEISIDTEEVGEIQNILLEDHSTSIELMQFTGLCDRNGTEIYEGDIIEWNDPHLVIVNMDVDAQGVMIKKEGNKVRAIVKYCEKEASFDPLSWYDVGLNNEDRKSIEVIGNKYENPELLEKDVVE